MIPGQNIGPNGMYGGYPQYQQPMMMGGKNAMKYSQATLKMVLNKVCGLNFLTEKDYKKMPMIGGMMAGAPLIGGGMMTQQQTSIMYMDKKSKKELFKRGSCMFFSMYPQTMGMPFPQLEQFVSANKQQTTQLFQPIGIPTMMPGVGLPMPMMPQPQQIPQMTMPPQPYPMNYVSSPPPPQPMAPVPSQPIPMPGQTVPGLYSQLPNPSGQMGSVPTSFYPPN